MPPPNVVPTPIPPADPEAALLARVYALVLGWPCIRCGRSWPCLCDIDQAADVPDAEAEQEVDTHL